VDFRVFAGKNELHTLDSRRVQEGREEDRLPRSAKVIRLRESTYQVWRGRKMSTTFSNSTNSAFAEILLICCRVRKAFSCFHKIMLMVMSFVLNRTIKNLRNNRGW